MISSNCSIEQSRQAGVRASERACRRIAIAVFMTLQQLRPHQHARRERVFRLAQQFLDRHFERRLPAIELRDQQVGVLVFLRADFADGSPEPLRDAAHRQSLPAPRRAELLQSFVGDSLTAGGVARFLLRIDSARSVPVRSIVASPVVFASRRTPKAEKSAPPLYRLL